MTTHQERLRAILASAQSMGQAKPRLWLCEKCGISYATLETWLAPKSANRARKPAAIYLAHLDLLIEIMVRSFAYDARVANSISKRGFSKNDDDFIIENYKDKSYKYLADYLKRSVSSVAQRIGKLGLRKSAARHIFSEEENLYIKHNYLELYCTEIANTLSVKVSALRVQIITLGLKKNSKKKHYEGK